MTPQKWSDEQTLDLIDSEHKKRLHPEPNGLDYHIAYHYLIFPDGTRIRTRPLDEVGYHAGNLSVNKKSVGICLIGDFEVEKPTSQQLKELQVLIGELQKELPIVSIKLHRDIKPTKCPGKNFDHKKLKKLLSPRVPLMQRIRRSAILKRFFNS